MITLDKAGTTLTLPDDLIWTDEFAWSPVVSNARTGLAGTLILDSGLRVAGRPITLSGEHVWLPRSDVDTLYSWAALPGQLLTLTFRSVSQSVVFDQASRSPIDAVPVIDYPEYDPTDYYSITIRMLKV